ncbi:MAG TPA: UDP-glucose/GDP-mannose dehydrogenase family protein [Candidatus Acidoferrales bacterium]|nr:UDP-glucose/GDP-mannose dehydrogenase family protein [Candidatus Acidoferrales bacterium]
MKISVIGTGYVGLVTGTCFAETGNNVVCMDVDAKKIAQLKKRKSPIYEPGLDSLLEKNINAGRLSFTTSLKEAVIDSQVIFLCLPTPPGADGGADLKYVIDVSQEIGKIIDTESRGTRGKLQGNAGEAAYKLLVTKSTVPIGTGDKIKEILKRYSNVKLEMASNPEFLKEGNAIQDFMFPDRVVLGVENEKAEQTLRELYEPFVRTGAPILLMEIRSAEMVKYAANAFLATRISFINEIASLCEKLEADVDKVRMAIGYDNRIGQKFLFPGIGWGGSCFPKDVKALIKMGEEVSVGTPVVSAVNAVNERQKRVLPQKVKRHFGLDLKDKKFAIWGLSFKPKTDDMREASSVVVIEELLKCRATVSAFDPVAMENAERIFGKKVSYAKDPYAALKNADALLLITEWQEFREPDFEKMKMLMKNPVIFDGRNIYNPGKVRAAGFEYYGIGRK